MYDSLRRTGEHVIVFNAIAKALTSTLKPREVLNVIMEQVSQILQPAAWSLLLQDERTGDLYFEIAVGEGSEQLRGLRLSPGEGIAGTAFSTGEVQIVTDVESSPNHARRFDELTKMQTRSVIALPLKARGRVLGVLELINGLDQNIDKQNLAALKAIADYAAIAIENARNFERVQELTIKDEHTGLYNARHLRDMLTQEVERAARFNHPLSFLFLDLDRFKEINDSHGHLVGSSLLAEVGQLLLGCIRKVDSAFRYGGDEFAIILVETALPGAITAGERIRDRFSRKEFLQAHGLSARMTASIGVATFPEHASNASDLLHAADQAMYRAKARGRNDVVVAAGPANPP